MQPSEMSTTERLKHVVISMSRALHLETRHVNGRYSTAQRVDEIAAEAILDQWPTLPKKIARQIIERYDLPHEITVSRMMWYATGPWKRTVVHRDEVPHHFPTPHVDALEQTLDYRVPLEKCDALLAFDGSILIDRTKGEITVRCDMEAMNVLTANLMHDVVTGTRTVEEARRAYADMASAFAMGRSAPDTERLRFDAPHGMTADADRSMIAGALLHQVGQSFKGIFHRTHREVLP